MTRPTRPLLAAIGAVLLATAAHAPVFALIAHPQVTKPVVPGITNFAKLESTIACAGATTPEAVVEVKKLGFASIINLRQASEPGADIDAEAAAAKEAGIRYVHLPLNGASPEPSVVERFLEAVVEPANQPVLVHCASGNRASALWLIKRMVVDGWDAERASAEATELGLTSVTLKTFAVNYAVSRKK